MIKTRINEIIGIEYPLFQGGMAWISDGRLAAAVSEAGGLGIIASGNAPAEYVLEQIRIAASLTDKPFGVNLMLMNPFADEIAEIIAQEKVKVVTTGAGNPLKYMKLWKEAGEVGEIVVIPKEEKKQTGVFCAYHENPQMYEHVWRNGIYHTGDSARIDEDGYFWFEGRIDDVIKTGGYRVGPFEIESVLSLHPAVVECSVVGVPDPSRG
ncbi:MAG: nitronate monooxygenase, partial [Firmicutes bacterium]|nr:nitronate monooxygenase [Bacillota bacterium]